MKKISTLFIAFFTIIFFGCEKGTEITTDNKNPEEKIFLVMDNQELEFNNNDELLAYVNGTGNYEILRNHITKLEDEIKKIEELGLTNLPEDNPEVIKYLNEFETQNELALKSAVSILYTDENFGGRAIYAPLANPRMKKKNRNKVSSVQAVTAITLCTKTWFRGSKYYVIGSKGTLPSNIDNNTESYF